VNKALVILAALALPAVGSAFEWGASAGLLYSRNDLWSEGGAHLAAPHLDIDLKLDAAGFLDRPGVVDWSAGAGYRRISDRLNGALTGLSNTLTYHLNLDFFRNRTSPVAASLYALQSDTRVDRFEGTTASGDRTLQRLGGSVRIAPPARPYVEAGYERLHLSEDLPDFSHTSTDHIVTGALRHSAANFSLGVQYRGDFSDGDWVSDQYDSYYLVAFAESRLGDTHEDRRLSVTERYYQRAATSASDAAYSVNANAFNATYQSGLLPGTRTLVSYQNSHGLNTTAALTNEVSGNDVRAEHDFAIEDSEFFVKGFAAGSLVQQRAAATELRSSGETVGGQLWWRRQAPAATYEAAAGPLIGFLQLPGKPDQLGYGASGLLRGGRPWNDYQLGLNYAVDWASDLFATPGWSVNQQLSATIGGAVGPGRIDGTLGVTARRAWGPVLGDGAMRGVQLNVNYAFGLHTIFGQAALQSGMAGTAPGEFAGDGLFLPAPFDSHTTSLLAGATSRLFTGLVGRLQGRYTSTHIPGQPDLTFTEGLASLVYHYAAFDFSLEDRYLVTDASSFRSRANSVMLNVSRAFGSRY
jgi:hypothetical protein